MKVPVHAPGIRHGETGKPWRGVLPPPGKHWQFIPAVLDELDAKNEIFWSKNGNPRRKVYLDQSAGISVQDIWMDFRDAHNQNIEITGYPTEKNIDLLNRIVSASSNPGDIVLDCFAGSGTTLVAADRLGRNWIGVDNSPEALRTMLHRFAHGSELMGDFVGKRTRSEDSKGRPNLFDAVNDDITEPAREDGSPLRITDFSLLTNLDDTPDILAVPEAHGIVSELGTLSRRGRQCPV
jgi:adenine-specific DNA-methyltransferase